MIANYLDIPTRCFISTRMLLQFSTSTKLLCEESECLNLTTSWGFYGLGSLTGTLRALPWNDKMELAPLSSGSEFVSMIEFPKVIGQTIAKMWVKVFSRNIILFFLLMAAWVCSSILYDASVRHTSTPTLEWCHLAHSSKLIDFDTEKSLSERYLMLKSHQIACF